MSDEQQQQQPPSNDEGNAPEAAGASEHLNLKVKSQDGNEVYFKVRPVAQSARITQITTVAVAFCLPLPCAHLNGVHTTFCFLLVIQVKKTTQFSKVMSAYCKKVCRSESYMLLLCSLCSVAHLFRLSHAYCCYLPGGSGSRICAIPLRRTALAAGSNACRRQCAR